MCPTYWKYPDFLIRKMELCNISRIWGKYDFIAPVKEKGYEVISGGTIFRELAAKKNMSVIELNEYAKTDKSIDDQIDNRTTELSKISLPLSAAISQRPSMPQSTFMFVSASSDFRAFARHCFNGYFDICAIVSEYFI